MSDKLNVRERIKRLFDAGTFIELGAYAKSRTLDVNADGVITGYGQIDGRLIYVAAEDFSVMNGSLGEVHTSKIVKCQKAAMKVGAPIIYIIDSGGFRIEEGLDALSGYGKVINNAVKASGVIPQISLVMGLCAGALTYLPSLSDFAIMVDKTSHMFITGPEVIGATIGQNISMDDIGSAEVNHKVSGVASLCATSEDDCIDKAKKLISYLPQNNLEKSEVINCTDDFNRTSNKLNNICEKVYDVKNIITDIADNNDFFEIQNEYAKNIVIGFIRFGGNVVGVVANQSNVEDGVIDINASDKAARFIRLCDSFNIPILTIEDAKGFKASISEEKNGLIRHFSKVLYAYSEATVPMITVIVNRAYGSAYVGMCSKYVGADMVYAWPSAKIGLIGAEAAVKVMHGDEIKNSKDPSKEVDKMIKEYNATVNNPKTAAGRGYIDDIIEPSDTRKILISAFDVLSSKMVVKSNKKHGNMPM